MDLKVYVDEERIRPLHVDTDKDSAVFVDTNLTNGCPLTSIDVYLELQKQWKGKSFKNRKIRKYYREQDNTIQQLMEAFDEVQDNYDNKSHEVFERRVKHAAIISFLVNILLLLAKLTAAILSGSLAVISSLVDSAVDLVSGVVIWWTTRAATNSSIYSYPFGRSRLEPAAIIIISVVMGLASLQMIVHSLQQLILRTADPDLDVVGIAMVSSTIVAKLGLYLYCRRIDSPSAQTLALDHRNDVFSNAFAGVFGLLGTYYIADLDPIGAIIISIYIAYNWWKTGHEQVEVITGKTAPIAVLRKLIWVSLYHSEKIRHIETVRAWHLGSGFIVEIHVNLPGNMLLSEAHDIGETLQTKLEKFREVEIAFVHLDYDIDHPVHAGHFNLFPKRTISTSSNC